MPLALLILTLSAFAIGTTEFVVMGLLPDIARDFSVSIPSAGWLVTGYALGVAIGGPIMALVTAKMNRKRALLMLMAIFIAGNILCAVAANYGFLMVARVITALCQGAFYGIGSVVAASLVPENRKASAVAMMFAGLTLATVLGVPIGTALGHAAGWRVPFYVIGGLGVIAFIGLWRILPNTNGNETVDLGSELRALSNGGIWMALATTVFFDASMFALFTYVSPLLETLTKLSPLGVTWSLFSIGLGLTIGNYIGGRLADWNLGVTLTGIAVTLIFVCISLRWTSSHFLLAEINLFIWAVVAFASVPALQVNVMQFGKNAPNLVATLNIAAFNIGNALGAWIGGVVLSENLGLRNVPVAAGIVAAATVFVTFASRAFASRIPTETQALSPVID